MLRRDSGSSSTLGSAESRPRLLLRHSLARVEGGLKRQGSLASCLDSPSPQPPLPPQSLAPGGGGSLQKKIQRQRVAHKMKAIFPETHHTVLQLKSVLAKTRG